MVMEAGSDLFQFLTSIHPTLGCNSFECAVANARSSFVFGKCFFSPEV